MKISARAGNQEIELTIERLNGHYVVEIDGERHEVDSYKLEGDFYSIVTGGRSYEVSVEPNADSYHVRHGAAAQVVTISDPSRRAREGIVGPDGPEKVISVMPGKVVRILVSEGDELQPGAGLLVVEAMKMENEITATKAGKVGAINVEPGQTVEGGAVLMVIE